MQIKIIRGDARVTITHWLSTINAISSSNICLICLTVLYHGENTLHFNEMIMKSALF